MLGSACGFAAHSGFAQTTDIQANREKSAYLQDGRGPVVRSQDGLCWRSGYWDASDAVAGCDGELISPVMKVTAPALAVVPEIANDQPTAPTLIARCEFTLSSDSTFSFGKAILSKTAKQNIDKNAISKLADCGTAKVILVTGYTDHLGTDGYNQKLSTQRAASVAKYLKSKGVTNKIEVVGAGSADPIVTCSNKLDHQKRIACLSPNRRVIIKIQ
ncbi:OmpA family protein [Collimonas arenae]|uniref:OmpA family protein n=1 Tax=Collimonas arenae TaxID=279058 RepID=UPI0020A12EBA|nr:OmpA family protein [Collimonas arenae]